MSHTQPTLTKYISERNRKLSILRPLQDKNSKIKSTYPDLSRQYRNRSSQTSPPSLIERCHHIAIQNLHHPK